MTSKTWLRWAAAAGAAVLITACGGPLKGLPRQAEWNVHGTVKGQDGKALSYASVALSGSPRGDVTDDQGRFDLSAIRRGTYGLTVIYLGFRSDEVRFTLPGADDSTATLEMVRDPELGPALADSLDPVTVTYGFTLAQETP